MNKLERLPMAKLFTQVKFLAARLYYVILKICNVRKISIWCNWLVSLSLSVTFTDLDKHSSLIICIFNIYVKQKDYNLGRLMPTLCRKALSVTNILAYLSCVNGDEGIGFIELTVVCTLSFQALNVNNCLNTNI
jgi:hypothetical protein